MAGRRTTLRCVAQRRCLLGALQALLVLGTCGLSFAEEGGCWTNCAGHVLRAVPQAIRGGRVTFVQDNPAQTVTYPLSVFPPQEQERLRCRLKDTALPEGLRGAYDFSGRIIKRSRLLSESGGMSSEECQKAVSTAVDAFRKQAAPFVAQKQLSAERLDRIARELAESKK